MKLYQAIMFGLALFNTLLVVARAPHENGAAMLFPMVAASVFLVIAVAQ